METQLFKALSDPTRLRCVMLLATHEELCVCDLTTALDLPQPKISHHLGNLRKAGLVSDRKQGLWHFYRLHPELHAWVHQVISETHKGLAEQIPYVSDSARLNDSEAAVCCG